MSLALTLCYRTLWVNLMQNHSMALAKAASFWIGSFIFNIDKVKGANEVKAWFHRAELNWLGIFFPGFDQKSFVHLILRSPIYAISNCSRFGAILWKLWSIEIWAILEKNGFFWYLQLQIFLGWIHYYLMLGNCKHIVSGI